MPQMTAAGHALEYVWVGGAGSGGPVLVFLHEGLGSIRQWRDFPERVARDRLPRAGLRPLRLRQFRDDAGRKRRRQIHA